MTLHTRPATNPARLGLTLLMMAGLTACGGGGGSGGTLIGEEVARELFTQDGVYRVEWKSNLVDEPFTLTRDGVVVEGTMTDISNSRSQFRQIYVSNSEIKHTSCGDPGIYTHTYDLEDLLGGKFLDDDPGSPGTCPSQQQSARFAKLEEGSYKIEAMCSGRLWGELYITRLGTDLMYNGGHFEINTTAQQFPNINATSGVCGNIYDIDVHYQYDQTLDSQLLSDLGTDWKEHTISVAAEYAGVLMEIDIDFSESPRVAKYTISQNYTPAANEVHVYFTSRNLDSPEDTFISVSATSGTVDITEITQLTARGTYDLQTEQGAFSGEFSIDLN